MKKETILIVDDMITSLKALTDILSEDWNVVTAETGTEALDLAEKGNPDIILLDIVLPDIDGYEVCRRLKSNPNQRDIPVLFITVKSDEKDEQYGLDLGAVDYITKPFSAPIVKARVRNHLKLKKAFENVKAASNAKTRFVANMSHEIRTPINAIIGMTDMALMTDDDSEVHEYLTVVKRSSAHLLDIINDILDFSKIESGVITLENKSFSVLEVMENIRKIILPKVSEKSLNLQYNIPVSVNNLSVMGDAVRYKQIILNLLNNAVKFTSEGNIILNFEINKIDNYNVNFIVFVQDTGMGIPADKLESIFDMHNRGDYLTSKNFTGNGLGLAISKELAELMGGEISVRSTPGKGSCFKVTLPFEISTEKLIHEEKTKTSNFEESLQNDKKMRILLAEDDEVNIFMVQTVLKKLNHSCTVARNGNEVLKLLEKETFDIIFMDIEMPEMNGIEAAELIRNGKHGINSSFIPIVAMTAHAFDEILSECVNAGMDSYITKPVRIEDLSGLLGGGSSNNKVNTDS